MSTEDTLFKTWEFKGIEIKPLSYARKANLFSVVDSSNFGMADVAAFLYGCICQESELIKGKRKLEFFDEKVNAWMNKIQFTPEDARVGAELITEIINHSDSNKASPIAEETSDNDLGNW
jgi:hypothetical protein